MAEQTTMTIPPHHKIRKMGIEDLDTIIVIRDYVRKNVATLIPSIYPSYEDWERMMDVLDGKIEALLKLKDEQTD